MKTKAAILVQQKKPLVITDIEVPALKAHQVLVRIEAAGVCGSQIGEIDGVKGPDRFLPHLLGHEAGAVVVETGPGVKKVKAGDHVVLHWKPSAGRDAATPVYRWGRRRVNAGRVTAFQELSVVSENRVTRIPRNVPFTTAALYGCALLTAWGVVTRDARLKRGESLLVLGAGTLGLSEIMFAKMIGASPIIAVDLYAGKLRVAKELGATHVIHSRTQNTHRLIQRDLKGRTLDVVFENTGRRDVIELGYELCGPKGRTILVGVPGYREKASIDTLPLHFGKALTGSFGGDARPDKDIPYLLSCQRKKAFDPTSLLSEPYSLDRINDAILDLRRGRVIRPVIACQTGGG
ncbi:MAG: zinc-binding dehydrogenase [Candidatus Omnitrophica bacterium]|nr:zinc-binding dehydrogenase [Candidatus Omnitrophota bacterium]